MRASQAPGAGGAAPAVGLGLSGSPGSDLATSTYWCGTGSDFTKRASINIAAHQIPRTTPAVSRARSSDIRRFPVLDSTVPVLLLACEIARTRADLYAPSVRRLDDDADAMERAVPRRRLVADRVAA